MVWLFKKKKDVLDLTERYKQQQEKIANIKEETQKQNSSFGGFGIFGMPASSPAPSSSSGYVDVSLDENEKKRKLAKRLMEITDRLENLSNQVYHLQQRVEVLEKKSNAGY